MEILSPAGSPEALRAAVCAGADAVYLGFGQFNARRGAKNFTRDEFAAAVSYCHLRGVKVYLTLNTLCSDREMAQAVDCAVQASQLGADAVLVQDMGLVRALRSTTPAQPVVRYECPLNIGGEARWSRIIARATWSADEPPRYMGTIGKATTAVLAATLTARFSGLAIDGYCGVLVGLFILYAGFQAARDTLNPLLGQAPDPAFVKQIEDIVMSHPAILGIHDLIVHNYGPGRVLISLHAEVPADGDLGKVSGKLWNPVSIHCPSY